MYVTWVKLSFKPHWCKTVDLFYLVLLSSTLTVVTNHNIIICEQLLMLNCLTRSSNFESYCMNVHTNTLHQFVCIPVWTCTSHMRVHIWVVDDLYCSVGYVYCSSYLLKLIVVFTVANNLSLICTCDMY